ncbi:unnamed protein product [Vitrella brassicaformis CCMP3155]|uniref:Secreted protein n=1 Tax=Vitrella brassicaformis (strain CCMP3155) TaxID=1169540 RepID=A0A0G4EQ04_VITBC|nr:unnamed protein product [Vitrella brassicaformis CCMP3155]|mmetsp:Transcript_6177/g.14882  ORF Transcript_6177/g.14882 Transcript_6177/m.14882 type:complete len:125 (-) Transcript_6177:89-463(-)|eukprot:CEL99504.1 unnamed protein product [Vitrella brassicaformis CCMP3155]
MTLVLHVLLVLVGVLFCGCEGVPLTRGFRHRDRRCAVGAQEINDMRSTRHNMNWCRPSYPLSKQKYLAPKWQREYKKTIERLTTLGTAGTSNFTGEDPTYRTRLIGPRALLFGLQQGQYYIHQQ